MLELLLLAAPMPETTIPTVEEVIEELIEEPEAPEPHDFLSAPPLDPYEEQRIILAAAEDAQSAQSEEPVRDEPPEPPYEEAEPTTTSESEGEPRNVWDDLADCESGNWVNGGASFETGSARWAWGGADPIPPWGTAIHDGGLQFHPDTWTWLKPDGYPARAYDASREQQIAVAERVLERQGWAAWPVCSRKLGLR